MIAFDTNLLVRLAIADDAGQLEIVRATIAEAEDAEESILLPVPVLCELVWALRSRHEIRRSAIVDAMRAILEERRFAIDRRREVELALARFEKGSGDFADYLIGEIARAEGARTTMTFDRALRREPGFTLL